MASIDRYFASSHSALRRQWSSPKIAIRLIIGNVIFWCVTYVQVIIFYNISTGICWYQLGAYGVFFSIFIAIGIGILPLLLLFIFGLLTANNVHKTGQRIEPIGTMHGGRHIQGSKTSKKDAQLHKMLANQVFIFIIFNMPNPCYLVYKALTVNTSKSLLRSTTEDFGGNMTYALIYLGFSLTFLNFIISSDMFRKEFLQLIRTKIFRQHPIPVATVRRDNKKNCEIN
ncbi:unnamed protein product [Adineta steineri]|uniref:G-protein coupled receptors family 1 profile domain-containing protein n=1 Tax=Adineta steineri TaxID=433720 RepID=A0A818L7R4_9BILA|nr:unnamed protein product [Adineta steineri]CAF0931096.1 unnamed protein product [Adineta steineri]CAF3573858.1 unnamed protein product [Adineta steineri]CAF3628177.1 unnamed protein product [Adineta steineri]